MENQTIQEKLQELQGLVVDETIRQIKNGECDSKVIGNAMKLLKDNNIVVELKKGKDQMTLLLEAVDDNDFNIKEPQKKMKLIPKKQNDVERLLEDKALLELLK